MISMRPPCRRLAVLVAAIGLAIAAQAHAADAPRIKIDNFAFTPNDLTVKVGTTVTFENDDDIPHQIVAADNSFRSKALDTGDTYAFTFTTLGDVAYFCGLHPFMQGKITVSR